MYPVVSRMTTPGSLSLACDGNAVAVTVINAKAAAQRRANLLTSVADLKAKLDSAKRDHEEAVLELGKLEPSEIRDGDRQLGKPDSNGLMIG